MDLEIWIPSFHRPANAGQMIQRLHPDLHPHTRIAVQHDDPHRSQYERLHGRGGVQVVIMYVSGIGNKRKAMAEHCLAPKILMLDDDIQFFKRKGTADYHLEQVTLDETLRLVDHVSACLNDVPVVGISARQGNNQLDWPGVENTRLFRAIAYRRDVFLSVEHGRVEVMEDFDVLLQLLRKGHPNWNISMYAQDQSQTQAAGGCSVYRTHELHERSARKLAELHPEFVKLVDKKNKTGGEFGTRKEVVISWKKAFKSSGV